MQNLCNRRVRALLTLAMLLALVSEPAWARSIFSHGDRRPLEAAKPAWAARALSRGYDVPNSWKQARLDGRRGLTWLLSHAQQYIIDLFDKVQVGANVYV